MSVTAWENDNSQFHARRRACLSGRSALPDRAAVLVIDTEAYARELARALSGQPVELLVTEDPADGLFLVGRTCPDAVLLGPVHGRLDTSTFLEVPDRRVDIRPLTLDLGRLKIDGAVPKMWLDGVETRLPMREYLLLRYLAERTGGVVSRQDVVRAIWGVEGVRGSNTLSVHIMRLRRRLHDDESDPQWIQVIRGLGYQFTIPSPSPGRSDT